jgi:hypothetical protein
MQMGLQVRWNEILQVPGPWARKGHQERRRGSVPHCPHGDAGIYMSMKRRRTHDGPINIYQRISTPKAATLKLGESGGTVRMGQ